METRLNKEQLEEISRFAGLFFTPREVAIIVGIDADRMARACRQREADPALYDAYFSGKLKEEALHRERVAVLSKQGSSPAQTMISDWIDNTNAKIIEG